MRITLAQMNPTIADFQGNLNLMLQTLKQAKQNGADLIVFSEMFLTGYPPRDLLERQDFIDQAAEALEELLNLSGQFPGIGILFGTITPCTRQTGHRLYNSAFLVENRKILFKQNKSLLPTYDVFDEARYFEPADQIDVFRYKGEVLGITICEDAWNRSELLPHREYPVDPIEILAGKDATLFINLSASPFYIGKEEVRYKLLKNYCQKYRIPFILVNQSGGNDELIFDGRSLVLDQSGELMLDLPAFKSAIQTVDLTQPSPKIAFTPQDPIESVYQALILGIQDYLSKCGFSSIVLGLSGGIDSAVVCALATDALGPKNVTGVAMPSMYSSEASVEDAEQLADNLGIDFKIIPIAKVHATILEMMTPHFKYLSPDATEENLQARIRGNILMALSNKFGALTLSTGNKSEIAVGYCTLYGDMSGGLSVISDVPKTMVYELAEFINRLDEIIPQRILDKPPSAELKPDQKDQDTLPPYDILDRILYLYLDKGESTEGIIKQGFEKETVDWIIQTVWKNEYKRRQAAPGLKVTSKAFGIGRRVPVASKFISPLDSN
ncbi:NAD+ synthase [candidate division KSB1 bacterium]|nr:NAD+ synthase [candidate division KSB1 bacterium]